MMNVNLKFSRWRKTRNLFFKECISKYDFNEPHDLHKSCNPFLEPSMLQKNQMKEVLNVKMVYFALSWIKSVCKFKERARDEGASCEYNINCKKGKCDGGICKLLGYGEDCGQDDNLCSDGICIDGVCARAKERDESCGSGSCEPNCDHHCNGDLVCFNWKCTDKRDFNDSCDNDEQCKDDSMCLNKDILVKEFEISLG